MTNISSPFHAKRVSGRYGEIIYFSRDSGAIRLALENYGEWAENELSFMRNFLSSGSTVVDVGAYIGTHMLAFAEYVGPNGHVISIEAQQQSFEILEQNARANGLGHVRVENAVAGETMQVSELLAIDPATAESFGSTAVAVAERDVAGTIEVRSITIDSFDLSHCDLIKIDVEGMEETVLKGAIATLDKLHPTIYAECNSVEHGLQTVQLLRAKGYNIYAHVVDAFNPDNFNGNGDDIFRGAREVAIVGVSGKAAEFCRSYKPRACELLLTIETVDDLALAMMNKPQYSVEILEGSAAGQSGGTAVLQSQVQTSLDLDACKTDIAVLKANAVNEAAIREQLETDTGWLKNDIADLNRDIVILRDTVTAKDEEKNDLLFQLQQAESNASNMEGIIAELGREKTSLLATAAIRDREKDELSGHLRQLEEKAGNLETQIAQIYASRSWRVTGPLRRLARIINRT